MYWVFGVYTHKHRIRRVMLPLLQWPWQVYSCLYTGWSTKSYQQMWLQHDFHHSNSFYVDQHLELVSLPQIRQSLGIPALATQVSISQDKNHMVIDPITKTKVTCYSCKTYQRSMPKTKGLVSESHTYIVLPGCVWKLSTTQTCHSNAKHADKPSQYITVEGFPMKFA